MREKTVPTYAFALSATLTAATLIFMSQPQAKATETNRSGDYLAYVSDRDGNDELYLSRIDGSETERLTINDGFDRAPHWVGVSGKLVFNSRRAPHVDRPQIYELDIRSGIQKRITESTVEEHRATFHENTQTVYLHRGKFGVVPFNIWAKNIATGVEKQLTHTTNANVWNAAPAISPDGRTVLFQSNRHIAAPHGPFPQKLFTLDLVSNTVERVADPAGITEETSLDGARWNKDGTKIVFSASLDTGGMLYLAEKNGAGEWESHAITDAALDAGAPAWSPDDTEIVFQATDPNDEDRTQIRVLTLATGATRVVGEGRTPVWVRMPEPDVQSTENAGGSRPADAVAQQHIEATGTKGAADVREPGARTENVSQRSERLAATGSKQNMTQTFFIAGLLTVAGAYVVSRRAQKKRA